MAYENTKQFLDGAADVGWEISSYLTQHILILLSAEVQQEIYKIADERSQVISDDSIKSFMSSTTKQLIRSVGKTDLSKFIGYFGQGAKDEFNRALDERAVTVYASALSKRHDIAHKGTCNATFAELEETIKCADQVLVALESAVHRTAAR
ncbi:hypothetical protein JYG36_10620 [Pseudomonas sp. SORT22]|uniref:hypothetical protein n=1 Tax=Pseudomonas sp. SORT22 TaxID=2813842 RepID=UPI001BCC1EEC|nr:hypothetical protein [Pseudomonas sp. SORT22]QVM98586.1 hypothetical protein JYG36_10620 [Pseudomonas sp. SORT22]